jgi:amidase
VNGTWVGASAAQIARAVQRGDTTAAAVVADHIEHARVADRVVTALRILRDGAALAEAEQVDDLPDLGNAPLAGVPVLVNEETPIAGQPSAAGDHEVVRRLRGAGAVVLGVSRMSELGLWPMTDDDTGVTRNPWRSDRSAGGPDGGAAAAVAAGIVPIAQGTDGLGSVRISAAACGLVGVKPGRGVTPSDGDWFGLVEQGILATTVTDAATGLAVLSGRVPSEPAPPSRVRIAVSLRNPSHGNPPDPHTREAVARAARLLVGGGHDAVRAEPPQPAKLAVMATATWFAAAHLAAEGKEGLQARTQRHAALGARALRRGLVRDGERADWRDRTITWFADGGFDALLTPALAGAPPAAAAWSSRSWRVNVTAALRYAPYAAPWNLAGLPAVVVPMGIRGDGLPASVQLVGTPGGEELLLGLAAQLEAAAPWRPHAPGWPRAASAAHRMIDS